MDRTRPNYVAMRAGMYESLKQGFAEAGIPWDECFRQDVGDSVLVLAPGHLPKGAFAGRLPGALAEALRAHNEAHSPVEQIKLRLALHAGEVTFDDYDGVAAPAIIEACRLLEATQLKDALASSPGTLAMIVSDWFYTDVIRHRPEYAPDAYRSVAVGVKEFSDVGWIRLPDHELPPEPLAPVEPLVVSTEPPAFTISIPRPSSNEFFEMVDALEDIPCMQGEHSRALVVDQLRFAGTIRYFPARRPHITSILRTSIDFPDGVLELVRAISNMESVDSVPLKRLLSLLTGGAL